MSDDRFDSGMRTRRRVLGDAYVDRAQRDASGVERDFQRYITENAWGSVWSRPGLDHRTRSLLTLVLLASHGHWPEFALHVKATRNTGVSADEVQEALFHVAIYAGVPAANRAFKIVKQELFGAGGNDE